MYFFACFPNGRDPTEDLTRQVATLVTDPLEQAFEAGTWHRADQHARVKGVGGVGSGGCGDSVRVGAGS